MIENRITEFLDAEAVDREVPQHCSSCGQRMLQKSELEFVDTDPGVPFEYLNGQVIMSAELIALQLAVCARTIIRWSGLSTKWPSRQHDFPQAVIYNERPRWFRDELVEWLTPERVELIRIDDQEYEEMAAEKDAEWSNEIPILEDSNDAND